MTVTALGGAVSDPTRARTYHYQREQAKHQPKGPRALARWLPGFVQHPPADDPVSGLIADRLGYETTVSTVSIGSSWAISARRSSQWGGMHMWVPSSSSSSSIRKPSGVE